MISISPKKLRTTVSTNNLYGGKNGRETGVKLAYRPVSLLFFPSDEHPMLLAGALPRQEDTPYKSRYAVGTDSDTPPGRCRLILAVPVLFRKNVVNYRIVTGNKKENIVEGKNH